MDVIVYIDIYFLTNVILDWLMLYVTAKLKKYNINRLRITTGAIFGALSACVFQVYIGNSLIIKLFLGYLLITAGMLIIAYPHYGIRELVSDFCYLYGVAVLIGGVLLVTLSMFNTTKVGQPSQPEENLSFLMVVIVVSLIGFTTPVLVSIVSQFRHKMNTIYRVTISLEGRKVEVSALMDTGNRLYDVISHKPVSIVESKVLEQIMDKSLMDYEERIKVIPYHSLGKSKGILYALVVDRIEIVTLDGKVSHEKVIMGYYEGVLSGAKEYQMILHEEMLLP